MHKPVPGNVKIVRLIMIPTKKQYNQVYQRSFTLNATGENLNHIATEFDKIGVKYGNRIPINLMGNTLHNIINVDNLPIDKVYIPNGWNTQRVRYIMEVESNTNGIITSSYIQGYSEYYDPSFNNLLDPNMFFYINSVTNVIRTFDIKTGTWTSRPYNTYNIVTDLAGNPALQEIDNSNKYLIRPQDINAQASMQEFSGNGVSVGAFNSELNGLVKTSKRSNNNQFEYLNRTLNGFIESKAVSGVTSNPSDVFMNAASSAGDTIINNTAFFELLRLAFGDTTPNKFTLNVLNSIDPEVSTPGFIQLTREEELDTFHKFNTVLDTEHTEAMLQPTPETIKAYTIIQTVNSLMLDNLITKMSLSITNETGEVEVIVTDANSIIRGIDLTMYVNRIVAGVKNLLINKITDNGYTLVTAHIQSDVLGDTSICIGLNGKPLTPYRMPTYADGLYSPMINSYQGMQGVVSDFMNITDLTF